MFDRFVEKRNALISWFSWNSKAKGFIYMFVYDPRVVADPRFNLSKQRKINGMVFELNRCKELLVVIKIVINYTILLEFTKKYYAIDYIEYKKKS